MLILLVGPPGAGKGTHGKRIAAKRGWSHVSSGELLRDAVERRTPLGLEAMEYMRAGSLVPDDIMLRWIEELLDDPKHRHGIVLDGFPRTVPQAEGLDALLERYGQEVACMLFFDISEEAAVGRLAARVSCTGCGTVYNLISRPPSTAEVCDRCGGKLEIREDDATETIRARFEEFRRLTEPMIEYYQAKGKLARVSTDGAIDDVGRRVTEVLDELCRCRDAEGTA